jgi:pullulanase/glycogen debranching enzyme
MDVVFNHTAEGNEKGPILSFRGVDNSVFYMLAPKVCLLKTLKFVSSSLGILFFGECQ